MNKTRALTILRVVSEITAAVLFFILLKNQKLQLWIIIFGITALLSVFWGRFYCSWICPMNTAFRGINWIYGKLKISRLKTPKFLRNDVLRIALLVLFIASMIVIKMMNLKLNMLLYLTLFAILLTLFFEEEFWHRRLCPFGMILSLTSRKSRLSMDIDEQACISCGKCQKVCPTSSIVTLENKKRRNTSHECLLCGRCIDVCPTSICRFVMKEKS
jgi:polyferredoxin